MSKKRHEQLLLNGCGAEFRQLYRTLTVHIAGDILVSISFCHTLGCAVVGSSSWIGCKNTVKSGDPVG